MAPITPPFADVLNSYMRHVVRELCVEPAVCEGLEKLIRSYLVETGEQERKPHYEAMKTTTTDNNIDED